MSIQRYPNPDLEARVAVLEANSITFDSVKAALAAATAPVDFNGQLLTSISSLHGTDEGNIRLQAFDAFSEDAGYLDIAGDTGNVALIATNDLSIGTFGALISMTAAGAVEITGTLTNNGAPVGGGGGNLDPAGPLAIGTINATSVAIGRAFGDNTVSGNTLIARAETTAEYSGADGAAGLWVYNSGDVAELRSGADLLFKSSGSQVAAFYATGTGGGLILGTTLATPSGLLQACSVFTDIAAGVLEVRGGNASPTAAANKVGGKLRLRGGQGSTLGTDKHGDVQVSLGRTVADGSTAKVAFTYGTSTDPFASELLALSRDTSGRAYLAAGGALTLSSFGGPGGSGGSLTFNDDDGGTARLEAGFGIQANAPEIALQAVDYLSLLASTGHVTFQAPVVNIAAATINRGPNLIGARVVEDETGGAGNVVHRTRWYGGDGNLGLTQQVHDVSVTETVAGAYALTAGGAITIDGVRADYEAVNKAASSTLEAGKVNYLTGADGSSYALPALSGVADGECVVVHHANASGTISRAGSDTINGGNGNTAMTAKTLAAGNSTIVFMRQSSTVWRVTPGGT